MRLTSLIHRVDHTPGPISMKQSVLLTEPVALRHGELRRSKRAAWLAIRGAGTSVPSNRPRESMRDRAHTPNGPALRAPEYSAAVPSLPHELCRRPVTRRATVRDWLGSVAHEDLRHESKKGPARPGGGNRAGLATNSGVARRERYRRPHHRQQQIECRAHQNVTASSHRHVTYRLSARARSFVVHVGAHVTRWVGGVEPRTLTIESSCCAHSRRLSTRRVISPPH
jgi:hypothetical protein